MVKHLFGRCRAGVVSSKFGLSASINASDKLFRHRHTLTLILMMFVLSLPSSLRAQADSLALPDDSGAAPLHSNAVAIVPVKGGVDLHADELKAAIRLANPSAPAGGKVALTARFAVAPGWHVYGAPLPPGEDLTPTSLTFGEDVAAHQSVTMPPPTPLHFEALGETLPVYQGDFTSSAELQLKPDLKPGPQTISGTLRFQECNNSLCKMPRTVEFILPLQISG